jgi:elongation factor Ts
MASAQDVQRLRAETGAGVMECKRALQDAGGDFERARELIRERGLTRAAAKAGRAATEGIVEAYVHRNRVGVLVELSSETDFVARNPEFRELARDIAMQVAAMAPRVVSEQDLSEEDRRALVREHGDEEQALRATVLLRQPFIRDASRTIGDLVSALAANTGENVHVRRFARFQVGEDRS